jgi:terminase, large subunit
LKHVQAHTHRTYKKASGFEMPVLLSGIDAKFLPDLVNGVCQGEYKYKIIPHMGSSSIGKPLVQGKTTASKQYGTFLTTLCPDTGKDMVYSMYKVEEPGPGYVHIPNNENFDESFIKQLCVEVKKIKNNVLRWICPDGARNEGLDMLVGALAICLLAQQRFGLRFVPAHLYRDDDSNQEPQTMNHQTRAASWYG